MPEEQAQEAVRLYREYYGETGLFENELIPGTVEFLTELKRRGKRVCLATSKPEKFSVRILEKFGVDKYFDFIGAASFDSSRSSKLAVIQYVLENTGAKPEECLMVGNDANEDMVACELGMDIFLLTDCLINAKNRDISVYPQGDFAALNAYLDRLNAEK